MENVAMALKKEKQEMKTGDLNAEKRKIFIKGPDLAMLNEGKCLTNASELNSTWRIFEKLLRDFDTGVTAFNPIGRPV